MPDPRIRGTDIAAERQVLDYAEPWTGIHIGKNSKLTLKFNGLKKLPYVVIDGKF